MATITLNVVSFKYYENKSTKFENYIVKKKVLTIKEDKRTVNVFHKKTNAEQFEKIYAGSVITLDDTALELNSYTNKQMQVIESLQIKDGAMFLVSGGTPPAAVATTPITLGQVATTPAPTQGIVLGQTAPTTAPTLSKEDEKTKKIEEMARIRDAWTEKLITALERNTLMMERLLTKNEKRPLTAYPDGITQEEMEKQDTGPSDEELQALYDEEGY